MSICCSSDRSTTPGTRLTAVAHALAEPPQRAEVVAEHLDGDVRARAGQHVVDAVRDRLADRDVRAGQRREAAAQARPASSSRGRPSRAGPRRSPPPRRPGRARLARRGPCRRAVATTSGCDSRICSTRRPISSDFAERRAGQRIGLHGQAALVEFGQERRAQPCDASPARRPAGPQTPRSRDADGRAPAAGSARNRALSVRASQPSWPSLDRARRAAGSSEHSAGVTITATSQRREQRHDVRERRAASAAGPRRRSARRSAGTPATMMTVANTIDVRISSVASRTTAAAGSCSPPGLRAVLAQPAHDVLDVDDRVVHERADGDRHAAERHGVDASRRRRAARGPPRPATAGWRSA